MGASDSQSPVGVDAPDMGVCVQFLVEMGPLGPILGICHGYLGGAPPGWGVVNIADTRAPGLGPGWPSKLTSEIDHAEEAMGQGSG